MLASPAAERNNFFRTGVSRDRLGLSNSKQVSRKKEDTDTTTSVQKHLLEPHMVGFWLFWRLKVKLIKYGKLFFFNSCSKHWPPSLSVDSYLRLNNADYHFKKLKNMTVQISLSTFKGTFFLKNTVFWIKGASFMDCKPIHICRRFQMQTWYFTLQAVQSGTSFSCIQQQ